MFSLTLSGCGGSADNSDDSSTDSTEIPNNSPDTYNIANVLNGNWALIDQEITVDADYIDDTTLNMYLVTASAVFDGTEITETRGLSTVSIRESWRTYIDGDTRTYLGIIPINLDSQVMSMVKSGADYWRCELYDAYKTVLNIHIIDQNLITITEHRTAEITSGALIEYDAELTFRKKED